MNLLELDIQEARDLLLLVKLLAELATLGLVQQTQDVGLVQSVVLVPDELEVGLTVGLEGKVMIANFGQKGFYLPLVLVDKFLDLYS